VADNLLTAGLVLAGFGAWAVVLPKLLVAPIWLVGVRRCQPWRPDREAGRVPDKEIWRFAVPVLGSEILATARLNLDKLLVGCFLGLPALGTYYFIFNAGIGFSLSLTGALSTAIYPHLAETSDAGTMLRRFDRAVLTVVLPAAGLIALQSAASLLYVPLVFGAHWRDSAPLVALLCLSAVTKPIADAAAQLLRAANRTGTEFAGSLGLTALYLGGFAIGLQYGLGAGVLAMTIVATILHLGFATGARITAARLPAVRTTVATACAL
jgi:PST family polysaccharide transporter